jgi:hypothetical protein
MVPRVYSDLKSKSRLLLVCHLFPLADGSTVEKEAILCMGVGLGGQRVWERRLRASYMYKGKHLWLGYLKKLEEDMWLPE